MSSRHERTLADVFHAPSKANIAWSDIEAMFRNAGAVVEERAGSRVAVKLNDVRAVFHRPHPEKEASRWTVETVRAFCREAGLIPPKEQR
jgi:hypothetical protein